MNVLHHLEASERASNAFYEVLGVGTAYCSQHRAFMFAVERHIV